MSSDEETPSDATKRPPDGEAEYVGNPYESRPTAFEPPITATLVDAPVEPPRKPRIWTALVVGIFTLPVAFVVATIVFVIAMLSEMELSSLNNPVALDAWMKEYATSRWGFLVLALPGQIVFLSVACGAAWLSPVGFRQRLRLVKGTMPPWTWLILGLATPAIGVLTTLILSLFVNEMSDSLEMLNDMFRSHRGWFLIVVIVTVAVLPGFGEEALFRGYLQSRLLQRWPPLAAISLSSVLFAMAHVDPLHVVAVLPIGFWLGVVAWRSESLLPSVICHTMNNVIALWMSHFSDPTALFVADAPTIGVLIVAGVALLASIPLLIRYGGPTKRSRWR